MAEFNYSTYSASLKATSLTLGNALATGSEGFYGSGGDTNVGEIVSMDFTPSGSQLYLTEVNSDVGLWNAMSVGATGFNFDAISAMVSTSLYDKVHYVFSSYDTGSGTPGDYWVTCASESAVNHNLEYESTWVYPCSPAAGVLHATMDDDENADTFYVVNCPLEPEGLIEVTRNKLSFRNWVASQSAGTLGVEMPPTGSTYTVNANGDDWPDVVVKVPGVDAGHGLTFYNVSNTTLPTITGSTYHESFIPPDVDSDGYPVVVSSHVLIHCSGSTWLRPEGSLSYWQYNDKYTTSGSTEWNFKPTKYVGTFGAGTKIAMNDGNYTNIESVTSGSTVKCGYVSNEFSGKMYVTLQQDDRTESGLNEAWRSWESSSISDLTVGSSDVLSTQTFGYTKWAKINNNIEVSLFQPLLVKDDSNVYRFCEPRRIQTGYKLINPGKSEVNVDSIAIESGSLKTFYGIDLEDHSTFFTSQSLAVNFYVGPPTIG